MVFSKKPITKYITWAIVTSQIPLPVIADSDNEIQSWIAGTASSISPHLQEGTLEDYAKGKRHRLFLRICRRGRWRIMPKEK
ncbi:invasin [Salmonella enterica]|nr:invasin [Salmonella enterica]